MTHLLRTSTGGWPDTRVSALLGIRYPIIQGPFGGGLSTPRLVGAVTGAGGLGSYGAHYVKPDQLSSLVDELRAATNGGQFAVNLWVETHDLPEPEMDQARFDAAVRALAPVYEASGSEPPTHPARFAATFEEQFEALLRNPPPVFSFVFGIPPQWALDACRERSIATIGTATTPDEVRALDDAGVDLIVASGFEAGGHRGAFLAPAEDSLVGTMPLVRIAAEEVGTPIVAAGGIADSRGILAAHALGAEGVQIGTAFLATEESGATPEHRALLRTDAGRRTILTRQFSGRLGRGLRNRLTDELVDAEAIAPYPYQGYLLKPLIDAARARGDTSVVAMWSGQGAPLIRHTRATDLFDDLVAGMGELLDAGARRAGRAQPA
jgi:nitronate monooxygenase